MIETICKNCGNIRVFEDSYAGRKFKCPVCGEVVEISPLKTDEIAEKDKVSSESVNVIVNQKKKELENQKKKLIAEKERIQKNIDKKCADIEKKLEECKEEDMKKFISERKLCRIVGWPFLIAFVLFIIGLTTKLFGDTIITILGIVVILGMIVFPSIRSSYRGFKRDFFGNNNDLVFTEEYEEAVRNAITEKMYDFRTLEKLKGAYRNDIWDVEDKIDNIEISIDKIEHPELYQNDEDEDKDE